MQEGGGIEGENVKKHPEKVLSGEEFREGKNVCKLFITYDMIICNRKVTANRNKRKKEGAISCWI